MSLHSLISTSRFLADEQMEICPYEVSYLLKSRYEELIDRRSHLGTLHSVTYSLKRNGRDINTDGIYTGITRPHSDTHSQEPRGLDMFKNYSPG